MAQTYVECNLDLYEVALGVGLVYCRGDLNIKSFIACEVVNDIVIHVGFFCDNLKKKRSELIVYG